MRNFSQATVAAREVLRTDYNTALAWARTKQKEAPEHIRYTIDQDGDQGIITEHAGYNGGNPPYQEIIFKSEPVKLGA
jgi:hypothetical protein